MIHKNCLLEMNVLLDSQSCDYYSDTYSHYTSHEPLIKDENRMRIYNQVFSTYEFLIKGKIVLDAGCGTGILSMMIAKRGAKKVYAIESTVMADFAKKIIETNGFDDVVTVIHGDLRSVQIPEKVDIIVSSGFGPCLFIDSSFEGIISAKNRLLKPDGIMMPNEARIIGAAISDVSFSNQRKHFWENVYGFDFSAIKNPSLKEPIIDFLASSYICSDDSLITSFDLKKMNQVDMNFSSSFPLEVNRDCELSGILIWFTVAFDYGRHPIYFSSSPFSKTSSFQNCILYLDDSIPIKRGDILECKLSLKQCTEQPKNWDFYLEMIIPNKTAPKKITQTYSYIF